MTGTDMHLATVHEMHRQNTVKAILFYTFMMGKYKMLTPLMTAGAASTQYFSSKAHERQQAAHCAPCQVMYKSKEIFKYLPESDLSRVLEDLFGTTDGLPTIFNESDSVAEAAGMSNALAIACNEAARLGQNARFTYASQIYQPVERAFQVYRGHALNALEDAYNAQRVKMRLPTTTRPEYHEKKAAILRVYHQELHTCDDSLDTAVNEVQPDSVVRAFQDLAKNG